ncbi:hypothetical protein PMIN01_07282 [Paraphaeosphaeria minitans]|uniref:Uncharacterized protein n=1 Tax=Paraphaeosphaeria minitans TaxID=565426 RepID=A0A9P6KQB7_9PLEO|nr:hypothetical protein PMIN01_07282 [Paraphaeosphaeria minitans]
MAAVASFPSFDGRAMGTMGERWLAWAPRKPPARPAICDMCTRTGDLVKLCLARQHSSPCQNSSKAPLPDVHLCLSQRASERRAFTTCLPTTDAELYGAADDIRGYFAQISSSRSSYHGSPTNHASRHATHFPNLTKETANVWTFFVRALRSHKTPPSVPRVLDVDFVFPVVLSETYGESFFLMFGSLVRGSLVRENTA